MITIFALPKAFAGHTAVIQRNAIGSWAALGAGVEVLLLGEEEGLAEAARDVGARHLSAVERTEHGTPRVSDAFRLAVRAARHDHLCYVNADIILLDDFVSALEAVHFPRFLAAGRRIDLDLREPIDFADQRWSIDLRRALAERGRPHPIYGIDYFAFTRRTGLEHMPPFAVGRPGWDNWLLREARRRRVPLIDASACVTAVHQDHDYRHVPGGDGRTYDGPEARENLRLMGSDAAGGPAPEDLLDATWILTPGGPRRALDREHLRRRRDRALAARPALRLPLAAASRAYRLAGSLLRAPDDRER